MAYKKHSAKGEVPAKETQPRRTRGSSATQADWSNKSTCQEAAPARGRQATKLIHTGAPSRFQLHVLALELPQLSK